MRISLLCMGKTDEKELEYLISKYEKRIKPYQKYERIELPDIKNRKNLSPEQQKKQESNAFLKQIKPTDFVILLDEKGKRFSSVSWANKMEQLFHQGAKRLIFVIGGPYGFDQEMYSKAQLKISISDMTFTHQMIRLFLVEQIYRSFTILHNKPYHHQ